MVSSGGHATAHAPEHALLVRRVGLEQVQRAAGGVDQDPSQAAVRNPDGRSLGWVSVVVFDGAGGGDAVAAPPPPQAATARAVSGITAALARKVMGLLRVMSLLRLGSIDSRSDQRLSNHATRSPRPETS